jgi:hypothetical protein
VVVTTAPYTLGDLFTPSNRKNIDCTNQLRRVLVPESGALLADLSEWTCPASQECRTRIGDVELRPDGVHFRGESARIVAKWLLDQAPATARSSGTEAMLR